MVPGPSGVRYATVRRSSQPFGITKGPNGTLWFTEQNGNRVGYVTP